MFYTIFIKELLVCFLLTVPCVLMMRNIQWHSWQFYENLPDALKFKMAVVKWGIRVRFVVREIPKTT